MSSPDSTPDYIDLEGDAKLQAAVHRHQRKYFEERVRHYIESPKTSQPYAPASDEVDLLEQAPPDLTNANAVYSPNGIMGDIPDQEFAQFLKNVAARDAKRNGNHPATVRPQKAVLARETLHRPGVKTLHDNGVDEMREVPAEKVAAINELIGKLAAYAKGNPLMARWSENMVPAGEAQTITIGIGLQRNRRGCDNINNIMIFVHQLVRQGFEIVQEESGRHKADLRYTEYRKPGMDERETAESYRFTLKVGNGQSAELLDVLRETLQQQCIHHAPARPPMTPERKAKIIQLVQKLPPNNKYAARWSSGLTPEGAPAVVIGIAVQRNEVGDNIEGIKKFAAALVHQGFEIVPHVLRNGERRELAYSAHEHTNAKNGTPALLESYQVTVKARCGQPRELAETLEKALQDHNVERTSLSLLVPRDSNPRPPAGSGSPMRRAA